MAKKSYAFLLADGPEEQADSAPESGNDSLGVFRKSALILLKTCSFGLRSGEFGANKAPLHVQAQLPRSRRPPYGPGRLAMTRKSSRPSIEPSNYLGTARRM